MSFTPTTLLDFITHFESTVTASNVFYYESGTNTINFGYGVNLTSAENAAIAGNPTIKNDLNTWFSLVGITITPTQWASFASTSLTSTTGPSIASSLRSSFAGNPADAAFSVLRNYVNNITFNDVDKVGHAPNLLDLPITTQWALESMDYNGAGTLGPGVYGDVTSSPLNLAGAAEQIAFNSSQPAINSAGLAERYLGAGMLALGVVPTYNNANQITDVNPFSAEEVKQAQNVAQLLVDTLNPTNTLGHGSTPGSVSAQSYISAWSDSNVTASFNNIIAELDTYLVPNGYYVDQSGDTSGNIITTLTSDAMPVTDIDAAGLLRINAPFGVTGFSTGTLLHLPLSEISLSSTPTALPTLFSNPTFTTDETYVIDPANSKAYIVGASLDGHDAGSLIIDNDTDGLTDYTTFARGTFSGASVSGGVASVELTAPDGTALGTYTAGSSFTFTTGYTASLTGASGASVPAATAGDTPEQALLEYLADLGDSTTAGALNTANFNYQNPTGSGSYPVSGTPDGSGDETFTLNNASPGASVTGVGGLNNILGATGDIVQDTISGVQVLDVSSNVALTGTQLSSFSTIEGSGVVTVASSGTYNLNTLPLTMGAGIDLTAADWGGTTLTGDSRNGETLTASLFGDDTLNAGSGTGDTLVAGEGVDTISAGNGGDTIVAANGLAYGSSVTGGTGADTLQADGDISSATISGVETLDIGTGGNITLTASQLAAFSTLDGSGTINASGAGTYDVTGIGNDFSNFSMNADATGNTTLTGNDADFEELHADDTSGNNTLSLGNGDTTILTADNSSGTNSLTAGDGVGDSLSAQHSFGDNSLTAGDGGGDTLNVNNSSGGNTLLAGDGNVDILSADDSDGDNSLTSGIGADDVLSANYSLGNNTLSAGGGNGDTVSVDGSGGDNTLSTGNGNSDTLSAQNSGGDNTLTAGNGTGDTLNVTGATGVSTLNGGSGGDTFIATTGLTSGSSVTGGTGSDTLDADGDISGATISGVETLNVGTGGNITLNATELGGFSTISGSGTINAAGAGTYSVSGASGAFNMNADATANTTLTGNGVASETISADNSSGDNTLNAGSGNLDIVTADYSSGDNTLTSGVGTSDVLHVDHSTGGNTVTSGNGGGDIITADYSSGVNHLNSGTGAADSITALNSIGNNILTGGSGNGDSVSVNGSSGNNTLSTGNGTSDELFAQSTSGSNTLTAGSGAGDVLSVLGSTGNNTLNAGNGGDVLIAGGGADTLNGGTGNDTFELATNMATGASISGGGGIDSLIVGNTDISNIAISSIFALGDASSTLALTNSQYSGITEYVNELGGTIALDPTDAGTFSLATKIVVGNFNLDASGDSSNVTLTGNSQASQHLTGGSGTDTLNAGSGAGDVLTAGSGTTTMNAGSGANTLNAGTGNDTLNGGNGTDTYNFGASFGNDTLNNIATGSKSTASGSVNFTSTGTTDEDLWFQRSGNDLQVILIGTSDKITISNWYGTNAGAQVSKFTADGLTLDTSIASLVSAMATYASANPSFNPATATSMPTDTTLQSAITSSWH